MDPKQRWWRVVIFGLITGTIIWWLFSQPTPKAGIDISSRVKGESIEQERVASDKVVNLIGKKAKQLLPDPVKEQISEIENRLIKKSNRVVEEAEIVQQIKTVIQQALEEIDNFPEKQKKEVKKEIVHQLCDQLLEEVKE